MATVAAVLVDFDALENKKHRPTNYEADWVALRALIAVLNDT